MLLDTKHRESLAHGRVAPATASEAAVAAVVGAASALGLTLQVRSGVWSAQGRQTFGIGLRQ